MLLFFKKKKKIKSFTQRHSHKMSFIKICRREILSQLGRLRRKRTKGLIWTIGKEENEIRR